MANPGPATTVTTNTVAQLAAQRTPVSTVNWASNTIRLLAAAKAVPITATGDIAVMPVINSTSFIVSAVYLTNAVGGTAALLNVSLNGGPAVTGTSIVAPTGALSTLTTSSKFVSATVATTAAGNSVQVATMGASSGASNFLYLNASAASTTATAIDVFVYGYDIS